MHKLQVDSVQLSYGDRKILQDIYLDCKTGEIIGLLGRNGSGKSSLLRIIFGTLATDHKYINLDEKVIAKGYHQNRIAYLPQHNFLPIGIRISSLAKMMVTSKYWNQFSNLDIYKNHQHKKTSQLSGGELRQFEMLMILYGKADFILLDEPFTHVTPVQADYFKELIKAVAKDKGIIITDHQYENVIDVSHRIILLDNGSTKHIKHVDELVTYHYISSLK